MISISSIVLDLSVLQDFFTDVAIDPDMQAATVGCARSIFASRSVPANDPNTSSQQAAVDWYLATVPGYLKDLTTMEACRSLLRRGGGKVVSLATDLAKSAVLDVVALLTTGGVKIAFSGANDIVPSTLSFFAPRAAGSEYFVEWERTRGGQPYIARVSQSPLPVAEFAYAQSTGHRVLLDASLSEGEGLRYDWELAKRTIGTGRTLTHDFGRAGRFDVTLTVTDRSGRTDVEHGSVTVAGGRAPEVRDLVCTPTGNGSAFTMQADLVDEDGDIARVEWRSVVSSPDPDEVVVAGRDVVGIAGRNRVTLNAPAGATHTRAQVMVVDASGNEAAKNCAVVLGTASPLPRISDSSAKEGESIDFTVTLDRAPSGTVTYYYATYRNTAGGEDYTEHRDRALKFGPGETSKTITVDTKEDAGVEGDEIFYLYITDDVSKLPDRGLPNSFLVRAVGTILDDDTDTGPGPAPTPSISDATADEGDSLTFTVTLDQAPSSSVTFYYATYATGTATGGNVDYYGRFATALTLGAGQSSKTFTISTVEDTEVEDDETFYVYLTDTASKHPSSGNPTDYLARATGTIRDDDTASTPTPSIANASAEEGDSITFTVTLDRTPSSTVTYYYATYRVTAGSSDYTGHDTTALRFSTGQTSRSITVSTTEDTVVENDETFYVYITDASSKLPNSGYPTDSLARATGTIRDDDAASTPTPSIANASAEEGESITFTVTLNRTPSSTVTYYYATYRVTAGSGDYTGHDTTALRFSTGQTSRTITVSTTEDTVVENDETFYVYLTDASSKHPNSGVPTDYLARATGTIRDDDTASTPTPSIANASAEEGDSITFTVTLDRTPSSTVTYYYATYRVTAGGSDYTGHDTTALRFSTGQTSRTITVSTTEDTVVESDETFYVYITDASSKHPNSGVPTDYLARATGTIRDDDTASTPTPSIANASAEEGDSITFTVTLNRTPSSTVTYYYATYRVTAGSGDYTGHDTTALRFSTGQTSRTITVSTTEDTVVENDETFYVYLTDASSKHPNSGVPTDYLARATGTIRDDDTASTPTPSIANASAEEGDSITFTVTLNRTPSSTVTYYYATYRVTAGSGDYTGHDTTALRFSTGQTSRTITVSTTEDTVVENDETFYVYLTDAASKHPNSGVPTDYLARATGTIRDDDTASTPTPSIANASAEEGDSITFTVTLNRTPSSTVTYYYATYRVTAGGSDYTGHDTTALRFSTGQTSRTITVSTTEDTVVESDETFYVYITDATSKLPNSGYPTDYLDRATGTIRDDDTPAAKPDLIVSSASLSDSSVEQGDRVRVDATVRNQGNGRASGSRVAYYISKVGTKTLTKVDDDSVSSLNPGSSDSEYDHIDTDDLDLGTYLVLIKADYDNRVAESDEDNNVYAGVNFRFTVTAPPLPDLIVSSASLGDTTVEQGDRIRISATVKNQGSGSAGRSRVAYYWGSNISNLAKIGDDSVSSLSAGESDDESINADTDDLEPGTYYVLIEADYEKDVEESNETNNIYAKLNFRFTVTAP